MYRARLTSVLFGCSLTILSFAALSCGDDDSSGPDEPVATVTVVPAAGTIAPGATLQLEATTKDAAGGTLTDRDIAWSSSDEDVATVSEAGLVSGVADGEATITATSEGKSGSAAVSVLTPVATVEVAPAEVTIAPAETSQLAAIARDAEGNELSGRAIAWSSSDESVATVSEDGLVLGVDDGVTTITATAEGQSGTAAINVVSVDISGTWVLDETLSDPNLGLTCTNHQEVTLVQTGSTFTGTNNQTGTCDQGFGEFDNSGTFEITDGLIESSAISFTQPSAIPCVYQGTTVGTPPTSMSGTVSCEGEVDFVVYDLDGTWEAARPGP
jgi:uncharacterized protein YjdB